MEFSPSRYSTQRKLATPPPEPSSGIGNMATVFSNHPPATLAQMGQPVDSRPMIQSGNSSPRRTVLPPISQMLSSSDLGSNRSRPTQLNWENDSVSSVPNGSPMTMRPRYPEDPTEPVSHKRRRISPDPEVENERREGVVSRNDEWAQAPLAQRPRSAVTTPQLSERRESTYSNTSYMSLPSVVHPNHYTPTQTPPYEPQRPEWQPGRYNLNLPPLAQAGVLPRSRSSLNEYALDSARPTPPTYHPTSRPSFDATLNYSHESPPPYSQYAYGQPRGLSYSGPSIHPTPFSYSGPHHGFTPGYGYATDQAEEGTRTRKRRGNLPKETTDILRGWFVAHLHHAYPTEDEKQELMRQTGLQMNQISNWFINARRRQLPAMMNDARAESAARSARQSADGGFPGSVEHGRRANSGSENGSPEVDSAFGLRGRGLLRREGSRDSI